MIRDTQDSVRDVVILGLKQERPKLKFEAFCMPNMNALNAIQPLKT